MGSVIPLPEKIHPTPSRPFSIGFTPGKLANVTATLREASARSDIPHHSQAERIGLTPDGLANLLANLTGVWEHDARVHALANLLGVPWEQALTFPPESDEAA